MDIDFTVCYWSCRRCNLYRNSIIRFWDFAIYVSMLRQTFSNLESFLTKLMGNESHVCFGGYWDSFDMRIWNDFFTQKLYTYGKRNLKDFFSKHKLLEGTACVLRPKFCFWFDFWTNYWTGSCQKKKFEYLGKYLSAFLHKQFWK